MKSLGTLNKNIILIAGSGSFVYEAAQYLTKKNILKKIYLLEENKLLLKSFSNMIIRSNVRNLELIIKDIRKLEIKNIDRKSVV